MVWVVLWAHPADRIVPGQVAYAVAYGLQLAALATALGAVSGRRHPVVSWFALGATGFAFFVLSWFFFIPSLVDGWWG